MLHYWVVCEGNKDNRDDERAIEFIDVITAIKNAEKLYDSGKWNCVKVELETNTTFITLWVNDIHL